MMTQQIASDGFYNVMKGLGGESDPSEITYFQKGIEITQGLANNLYTYNWLARKVVDIPVDDATRKWRTLLIADTKKKEEIENSLEQYKIKEKINTAMKWARAFGGAAILVIIDGEDLLEELNIERIRKDSLVNFIVLDRYNLYPTVHNRNVLSPNFGEADFYTVSRGGQNIHNSRVIKFNGVIPTIREYEQNNYWGNSIFSYLWEPIRDSQTTSKAISSLIYESNVDVYLINELNRLLAEGQDELVMKRLKIAHQMKGIINGIALDGEDKYDKKSNNFANLDTIDDRYVQKVSGASNIPVTRLIGISPAGMNATGESDMYNYYDYIQSIQENEMRPKIDWMDQIVMASVYGSTEKVEYEFRPLRQLTEQEKTDIETKRAQRDQIYLNYDIIQAVDVLAQLSEDGTYTTVDANRVAVEKEREEIDFNNESENGEEA